MFQIVRESWLCQLILELIAFIRNRFAVDLGQGVHGSFLLGFLLIAAPGSVIAVPADDRGNLEALAVIGTLLIQKHILRGGVELALSDLLEERLEVAAMGALGHFFNF